MAKGGTRLLLKISRLLIQLNIFGILQENKLLATKIAAQSAKGYSLTKLNSHAKTDERGNTPIENRN